MKADNGQTVGILYFVRTKYLYGPIKVNQFHNTLI